MAGWQWHQLDHMHIIKFAPRSRVQTDNHAGTITATKNNLQPFRRVLTQW